MSDKENLQKLIELSHIVSKPIKMTVWVLCGLLALSVCGNIYQATIQSDITVTMDGFVDNNSNQIQELVK